MCFYRSSIMNDGDESSKLSLLVLIIKINNFLGIIAAEEVIENSQVQETQVIQINYDIINCLIKYNYLIF